MAPFRLRVFANRGGHIPYNVFDRDKRGCAIGLTGVGSY